MMRPIYFNSENERLPQHLVTMRIRFVRCAISTLGNEHLIRLSIVSLNRMCQWCLPHHRGTHSNSQQTEEAHCYNVALCRFDRE